MFIKEIFLKIFKHLASVFSWNIPEFFRTVDLFIYLFIYLFIFLLI